MWIQYKNLNPDDLSSNMRPSLLISTRRLKVDFVDGAAATSGDDVRSFLNNILISSKHF